MMNRKPNKTSFKKGNIPWNKGRSVMLNTALVDWLAEGNRAGQATRFKKGQKSWNKGTKGIMKPNKGSFKKGVIPWIKGKKHSLDSIAKMRVSHTGQLVGEKHPMWKGGVSRGYRKGYKSDHKYRSWRESIFERDDYTCQECGKRGIYIEPHHIISWANHPKLRYEKSNGTTLCQTCHSKTDNYRGKSNKKQLCLS